MSDPEYVVTCADCGVQFGVTKEHNNVLRNSGNNFYCPNGHCNNYLVNENEEDTRDERIEFLEQEVRSAHYSMDYYKHLVAYHKGQLTKYKKQHG